jgi:hypothetical protein
VIEQRANVSVAKYQSSWLRWRNFRERLGRNSFRQGRL